MVSLVKSSVAIGIGGEHTTEVLCGAVYHLVVSQSMRPGAIPYATQPADNVFSDATILRELAAQLLDHAVDVVELSLVASGSGHGHAGGHVCAVHAVHHVCVVLRVLLVLRLLLALQLLLMELELLLALESADASASTAGVIAVAVAEVLLRKLLCELLLRRYLRMERELLLLVSSRGRGWGRRRIVGAWRRRKVHVLLARAVLGRLY